MRQPDAALLKAVLDSIPGRVSIVDTEDRYLFANQELLNFFGRPASDLIGRRLVEILGEAAHAGLRSVERQGAAPARSPNSRDGSTISARGGAT